MWARMRGLAFSPRVIHGPAIKAEARKLALSIAHWMIAKVPHTDGAIAMGQIPWNSTPWNQIYSTENNLSTYAFMGDLLKATDLRPDERLLISQEHDRIGNWLIKKAYQPSTHSGPARILIFMDWTVPGRI